MRTATARVDAERERRFERLGRGLVGLFLLYMVAQVSLRPWQSPITWDAFGYHLYLPLSIVHRDLGMRDPAVVEGMFTQYQPSSTFYQAHKTPTGDMLIRYSPGVAVLDLPAFLIAHGLAAPMGFSADGLSRPYQYAAMALYIGYLAIGLWFLLRVLERLFGSRVAMITLLVLLLGTNLLVQFERSCLLTHGYAFMLFALLLWCTMRWHEAPTIRRSIALGALLGLIAMVRPTDALAALIPILWPLPGANGLRAKIRSVLKEHRTQLWIAVAAALVAFFPLPLYWKLHGGSWFYDSYQNPGEGLDLLYPHTLKFLFSFRKGWFLYTPMMLLAVIGFVPLYRKYRRIAIALLVFFIVDLYVVSSWTLWYYPGGFGQRAMVQAYPVMAIALAALILWVGEWGITGRRTAVAMIILLTLLNLHQTVQYRLKVLDPMRMTQASYAASFFDLKADPEDEHLLSLARPTVQVAHADLQGYAPFRSQRLEKDASATPAPQGRTAWRLDDEHPYSPAIEASFREVTSGDHAWLRIRAQVWCDSAITPHGTVLVAHFDHDGTYAYQTFDMADDAVPGRWSAVTFDYLTPEPRRPSDRFKVYAWHIGGLPAWVDSLEVTSFVPIER